MKATNTVPSANEGAPEKSHACTPVQSMNVPDGTSQWERFRAGVTAIVSVPKEQVNAVLEAEQAKRTKIREAK